MICCLWLQVWQNSIIDCQNAGLEIHFHSVEFVVTRGMAQIAAAWRGSPTCLLGFDSKASINPPPQDLHVPPAFHWKPLETSQHPLILITPEPKKKILVNSGTAVVTPALDQDHPPGTPMVPKLQGPAHGKGNGQIIVSLKAGICEVRVNLLRWSLSVYLRDKSSFWSCCSLKADPG